MRELTGGLAYHWRALRYRKGLWAPFRVEVARWLGDWRPPERKLLLVGPSAGHCLPGRDWFGGFKQVSAVDPDRVARLWLQARLGRRVVWSREDFLSPRNGDFDPARVDALLHAFPGHAVLFCNLLGQLRFLDQGAALADTFGTWKRGLERALAGRSWASFHDRLSGPARPRGAPGALLGDSQDVLTDSDILGRFYGPDSAVLLDHLTGDLFPGRPRQFWSWQLRPGVFHLIEAMSAVAGDGAVTGARPSQSLEPVSASCMVGDGGP